jgi:hypothetical protein
MHHNSLGGKMEIDSNSPVKWKKSSKSAGGNCVEVAMVATAVLVRDSKAPTEGGLTFSSDSWASFIQAVKSQVREPQ